MQYFSKVKAAASKFTQQGAQLLSAVLTTNAAANPSNTNTATSYTKEELQELFEQVLHCIDSLAASYDAMIPSFETDPKLNASSIGLDLKRIIAILKFDSEKWLAIQRKVDHDHMEESDIPCLDYFIQSNMIQSLCNRAHLDIPRGVMPLVLKALTLLLKSVPYPLLPHQSIHKSVAKIISVAARYDAIVGVYSDRRKSIVEAEQYLTYRKRVDITLTGLLKVLWRKILENPPILDYFILSDRRSRFSIEGGSPSKFTPESSPSKAASSEIRTQIDILSALIPLMFESKLGSFAQESILIALNLQDARIDHFLVHHTKFVSTLVQMLSESFREALTCLISLQKQASASSTGNSNTVSAECNWLPNHMLSLGQFGATNQSNNSLNPSPASAKRASVTSNTTTTSSSNKGNPLLSPDSRSSVGNTMKTPMRSQDVNNVLNSPNPNASSTSAADEAWGPVERFMRVLMFLRAVYSVLLDCIHNAKMSSITEDFGYGMTNSYEEKSALLHDLATKFHKLFLQGTLWTSLESSNEGYNTALYTLIRMMLTILSKCEEYQQDSSEDFLAGEKTSNHSTLFTETQLEEDSTTQHNNFFTSFASPSKKPATGESPSSASMPHSVSKNTSLLTSTLRYLLFPVNAATGEVLAADSLSSSKLQFSPFYWSLLDRMTSYSKPLSLASVCLANDIVSYTPPLLTQQLVVLCRHNNATPNNTTTTNSSESKGGSADMKGLTLDDAIARMCKSIELERSQTSKGSNTQALNVYIDLSIRNVMKKVFHAGDHIAITRRLYPQPGSTSSSSSATETPSEGNGELYVDRIQRRLQSYFTLRVDEQIALSGVLQETACLLATSMIVIPSTEMGNKYLKEEEGKRILSLQMGMLKKISMLRQDMANYLKQVPDFERKLDMIREYMAQEAVTTLLPVVTPTANSATDSPGSFDTPAAKESSKQTSIRKYLETESMQHKQILVGSIVLQEIQQELQSYVFAVQFIRKTLLNNFEDDSFSALSTTEGDSRRQQQHADYDEQEEDLQDLLAMQTLVKSFDIAATFSTPSTSFYGSGNARPTKSMPVKKCLELEVVEQEFNRDFDQLQETLDQLASSSG